MHNIIIEWQDKELLAIFKPISILCHIFTSRNKLTAYNTFKYLTSASVFLLLRVYHKFIFLMTIL